MRDIKKPMYSPRDMDRPEVRKASVDGIVLDYLAVCIAEKMEGSSEITEETFRVLGKHVPMLATDTCKSLLDPVVEELAADNNEYNTEGTSKRIKEASDRQGVTPYITQIVNALNNSQLFDLGKEMAPQAKKRYAFTMALDNLVDNCDGHNKTLSAILSRLQNGAEHVPEGQRAELTKCIDQIKKLSDEFETIKKPFGSGMNVIPDYNNLGLAVSRYKAASATATNAIKQAKAVVSSLHSRGLIADAEVNMPSGYVEMPFKNDIGVKISSMHSDFLRQTSSF